MNVPPDLAALLVEARAVSQDDVQRALQRQRDSGGGLDTALLELDLVPADELVAFLSLASGLPPAPDTSPALDPRAARVFPGTVAERHRLAPLRLEGSELSVLAAHPVDRAALAHIGIMLSLKLLPLVAPEWRVRQQLARAYGVPVPERLSVLAARFTVAPPEPEAQVAPPSVMGGEVVQSRDPAETWRLGRADPEEPLATAVARAAEAFDASVVLREALDPPPVPEESPGWTLRDAAAALDAARDRDEVVAAALRYTRDFLQAAAVFAMTREGVSGIDAVGWPAARSRCRAVHLPSDGPGLFRAVTATRGPYLGPIAHEPGNEQLLRTLQRPWPAVALAYPVVLRERVVCIVYGDNGDAPVSPSRIGDLLLFATKLGGALERVVREAKGTAVATPPHEDAGGWHVREAHSTAASGVRPPEPDPFRIAPASQAIAALEREAAAAATPPDARTPTPGTARS